MKMIAKVLMMVVLLAQGATQATAVTYKPYSTDDAERSYGRQGVQPNQGATMPSASFQSTSTMPLVTEIEVPNTLNADGTVNEQAYNMGRNNAPGGPRKLPGNPSPVGDAVLPLLLMALAFCGVVYMRKRKAQA